MLHEKRTNTLRSVLVDRPSSGARLTLGIAVYWAIRAGQRNAIVACADVCYKIKDTNSPSSFALAKEKMFTVHTYECTQFWLG